MKRFALPHRRYPRRPGFSLVEMVVSLAVVSVLLAGMTSAVVLASRALPTNDGPAAAQVESARALHQFRDDLRAATELLDRTATSVTLHLPDRDGDGRAEVVTYAWAGNAGDPLTRTVNGNAGVIVLRSLESFALAYTTADHDSVFPGAAGTSSEQLLSSFDSSSPSTNQDHLLESSTLIGTTVSPTLPATATSWQITRALFYGGKHGAPTSTVTFELRESSGGSPTTAVLASDTLAETDMSSWDWYEATFNSGPFDPADDVAIVLVNHGGGSAGYWTYSVADTPPSAMLRSNDGGATWLAPGTTEELKHYVYGTYESTGDDWTYTRPRATTVEIELIHGDARATTHRLGVAPLNAPDAADFLLESDMTADPTTLDLDGDGAADWEVPDNASPGTISDGVLTMEKELKRIGLGTLLDQPFTLDLRLRDDTDDNNPAKLEVKYDLESGIAAKFKLYVQRVGNEQTVTLYTHSPDHTDIELHTATAPAGRMVAIELVVDTDRDTLAIVVDDDAPQSYAYLRSHDDHTGEVKIKPEGVGSVIQLDHLRLTVGGTATLTPNAYPGS